MRDSSSSTDIKVGDQVCAIEYCTTSPSAEARPYGFASPSRLSSMVKAMRHPKP